MFCPNPTGVPPPNLVPRGGARPLSQLWHTLPPEQRQQVCQVLSQLVSRCLSSPPAGRKGGEA
jgi:hypothetical protein